MTTSLAPIRDTPSVVTRTEADGVVTLTLNRPAARNSLSRGLMSALQESFEAITKSAARVVILAGA